MSAGAEEAPGEDRAVPLEPGGARDPARSPLVSYEVRAQVPMALAEAYERYLREEHIPDLLATDCFVEASFARLEAGQGAGTPGEGGAESVRFRSAYLARNGEALARYLADHAPALRKHALARFPEGLTFEREVWEVRERRWARGGGALDPIP